VIFFQLRGCSRKLLVLERLAIYTLETERLRASGCPGPLSRTRRNLNARFRYSMRWDGHVARMGEERGVYKVLVGKPEGRKQMGRPMRRWVHNIRMDLQEVGCGYVDWIGLALDRDSWRTLVSAVMNLRVP